MEYLLYVPRQSGSYPDKYEFPSYVFFFITKLAGLYLLLLSQVCIYCMCIYLQLLNYLHRCVINDKRILRCFDDLPSLGTRKDKVLYVSKCVSLQTSLLICRAPTCTQTFMSTCRLPQ